MQIKVTSSKARKRGCPGGLLVDDASELRRLAEWYRAFAEVGHSDQREGRLKMAEYLERKADELERRAANDPP